MSVYQLDAARLDAVLLDGASVSAVVGSTDEITFNSYGLQNANILTRFVKVSAPILDLQKRAYPRAQGAYAETAYWRETHLILRGTIKGSSRTDMESRMDTLRQNLSVFGGILKIPWAGVSRYYECYAIGLDRIFQERDHYHMTMCPFEVELVALQPFGRSGIRTVTDVPTPVAASPTTMEFVNAGTSEADSLAYLTVITAGTLSQIIWENTTNGDRLVVAGTFMNGDQIVIDGENRRVTKNGTEIDYTGVLPKINAGSNAFQITLTGSGYSISVSELHYSRYY
jgi:hypothetical protein